VEIITETIYIANRQVTYWVFNEVAIEYSSFKCGQSLHHGYLKNCNFKVGLF
jgi:hypothetical protein